MNKQQLPVLYQVPALPRVMKTILIADAATGGHTQVTIHPGTTAGDVLKQAGFSQNFALTRNREGESIPMDENLYESIPDGAKVWASTPVDFGSGRSPLWDFNDTLIPPPDINAILARLKTPTRLAYEPPICPRPSIHVTCRIDVKPSQLPYWQEKGWTRSRDAFNTVYTGFFHSPRHKVQGKIEEGVFCCKISVHNPPEHVLRHHHTWGCFHRRSNDWWEIHHHGCPNASSAILQVERTLNEAEENQNARLY